MRPVRCLRFAAIRIVVAAASVCFLFAPNEVAPPASAQSARPPDLAGALMGLHDEFPETLHKITPELLKLQEQLVDELRVVEAGVREEDKVGQRTVADVVKAAEDYLRALEALQVMTARSRNESITEQEILGIRIDVRSQALAVLKRDSEAIKSRFMAGEVTSTDVALVKARALKAEMVLEALKNAAGLTDVTKDAKGTAVPK